MFPVFHFIKNVKHTYYRQYTEVCVCAKTFQNRSRFEEIISY